MATKLLVITLDNDLVAVIALRRMLRISYSACIYLPRPRNRCAAPAHFFHAFSRRGIVAY